MKNLEQIIKEEYRKILQEQAQNRLTKTLKIRKIHGDFECDGNELTSLKGAPSSVGGHFDCSDNNLTSLESAPSSVGRSFNCSFNDLTSLKDSPTSVDGNFYCDNNNLTSLEGAPSSVGDNFDCRDQKNGIEFTEEDVRKVSDVKGRILT